jgi:DNA-binding NtrC family response regulator
MLFPTPYTRDLRTLVREFERQLILHALEQHHGHQRRAAASLGIRPTTLHEKMKRLGILSASAEPMSSGLR